MVFKTTCVGSIPAILVIVNIWRPNQLLKKIINRNPKRTTVSQRNALFRKHRTSPFRRLKRAMNWLGSNPVTTARRRRRFIKAAAGRSYTRKHRTMSSYSMRGASRTLAKIKKQQIMRYDNSWGIIILGASRKKVNALKPRNSIQARHKIRLDAKRSAVSKVPRRRIHSRARVRVTMRRRSRFRVQKRYRIKHKLAAYKRAKARWSLSNDASTSQPFHRYRTLRSVARSARHKISSVPKIIKSLRAYRTSNTRLWSKLIHRLDSRLREFNLKMKVSGNRSHPKTPRPFKLTKRPLKFRGRMKSPRGGYVTRNLGRTNKPTTFLSRVQKPRIALVNTTQPLSARSVNVRGRKFRRPTRKVNVKSYKTLMTRHAYTYSNSDIKLPLFKSPKLLKRSRLTARLIKKVFRKRKITSKKVNTTRSYNLLYSERFSLKFTENSFTTNHDTTVYPQSLYSLRVHNKLNPFVVDVLTSATYLGFMSSWGDYFAYSQNYQIFSKTQTPQIQVTYKPTLVNAAYVSQVYNLFANSKSACLSLNASLHKNIQSTSSIDNINSLAGQPRTQTKLRKYLASSLAHAWSLEMGFIKRKHLNSPNAVFILAKAPTYRMHAYSSWPISTSQHYGNFFNNEIHYSKSNGNVNKASVLFTKVQINPVADNFSGFRKSGLSPHVVDRLITRVRTCARKNMKEAYKKLLYTNPILNFTFSSKGKSLKSPTTSARIFNMRQITVTKRRSTRWSKRGKPRSLRKQKFIIKQNAISLKTRRKAYRVLRRTLRRVNKFARWRTRKATFFFTRFLRVHKQRKALIKAFSWSNPTHTRQSKYSGFTTKLVKYANRTLNTTIIGSSENSARTLCPINFTGSGSLGLLTNSQLAWFTLTNPLTLKALMFSLNNLTSHRTLSTALGTRLDGLLGDDSSIYSTNLIPHSAFQKHFSKKVLNSFANQRLREDLIPLYQNTLIRFIEFCTGKKAMFQFYPFVNQHVDKEYMVRYKKWLPRMSFYERRLGHRFFLEESLHIMHLSFALRDPKIIASWLRAIILRISFWKTRSIFRFLKYLFHNYFIHVFDDIRIKGLKIRLKGKISAAGNSRKRTILYRVGKTSHSEVNLRVVKDFSLINTFTGVMGFQVYLFY